jgi:octaprenyl-diphosphate synthase
VNFFTNSIGPARTEAAISPLALPFNLVKKHLQIVEGEISAQVRAFDPGIEEYVKYAVESRGKRLRPALVLLVGGATGNIGQEHVNLAVILELIHLATLIHDDIIDGAELRRERPTANALWGNATSVLLGDALFAHAMKLSASFEDAEICRQIANATSDVCAGEIIQTQRRRDWKLTLEEYYRIIEMKTGALFVLASDLAARLNHQEPAVQENCREYGRKLGIAYQIYDDCLDIAGSEEAAGKTLRTDLGKGKLTLPILRMLNESTDLRHKEICELLEDGGEPAVNQLADMAIAGGYVHRSIEETRALVAAAKAHAVALPDTEYSQGMQAIGDVLLSLLAKIDQ